MLEPEKMKLSQGRHGRLQKLAEHRPWFILHSQEAELCVVGLSGIAAWKLYEQVHGFAARLVLSLEQAAEMQGPVEIKGEHG